MTSFLTGPQFIVTSLFLTIFVCYSFSFQLQAQIILQINTALASKTSSPNFLLDQSMLDESIHFGLFEEMPDFDQVSELHTSSVPQ